MSARRKPGLYADCIELIQAARFHDEESFMNMLRTYGELDQTTIGVLLGRSQSYVSRHLNGGAGLLLNREKQRTRNRELKQPPVDPETYVRLLAERLAVEMRPQTEAIVEAITQAGRAIATKIDTATASEKRR